MTKSILLVLDMINDTVNVDGPAGITALGKQVAVQGIISKTAAVIKRARKAGILIGYVRVGFSVDYKECSRVSPVFGPLIGSGLYKLGGWGTQVHPELRPEPQDFDIIKTRVSPFYGSQLDPILRAHRIARLYVCGASTSGVVQAALREGHDRDYECFIIEDCCCASSIEEHQSTIAGMRRFLHGVVASSDLTLEGE